MNLRAISLALALLAFWLVLSGHYEPRMLALGVGSVLLVLYLSIRMGVVDEEGVPVVGAAAGPAGEQPPHSTQCRRQRHWPIPRSH